MFLIYINDFPKLSLHTVLTLFADDSALWRSGKNINHIRLHLQEELKLVERWCKDWGFILNQNKTTAVIFTRKKNIWLDLRINNVPIKFVKSFRFLGFIFDDRLTWMPLCDEIVQRYKSRLNLLKCLSHVDGGSRLNTLLTVYRSMIRSIIDYG